MHECLYTYTVNQEIFVVKNFHRPIQLRKLNTGNIFYYKYLEHILDSATCIVYEAYIRLLLDLAHEAYSIESNVFQLFKGDYSGESCWH